VDSQIKKKFHKDDPKIRATQGDILKDLDLITYDGNEGSESILTNTFLNYAIILSQDCDLLQDYDSRKESTFDKNLSNILILPAYLSEDLRNGTHKGANIQCGKWNSEQWRNIKLNQNQRFHFIDQFIENQIPELVIDFKEVYTIKRDYLYKILNEKYVATICELYRENISQRYSQYLSRIGLP
jgi:hypothetical protein